MGKNACVCDAIIVLGPGPKRDVVVVSGFVMAAADGVLVTAAFSGTICAVGARRCTDEEGANPSISPAGLKILGSLDLVVIAPCDSFGFECCCMSLAKNDDASIASFAVDWKFGSF